MTTIVKSGLFSIVSLTSIVIGILSDRNPIRKERIVFEISLGAIIIRG